MSKKHGRPPTLPGVLPKVPTRTPITEVEGLRFRVSKMRDAINSLNRKLLQKDTELCDLRERIALFENERDIGALHLREEDNILIEDGKYFIERRFGAPLEPPKPPKLPEPPSVPRPGDPLETKTQEAPQPVDQEPDDEDNGEEDENGEEQPQADK